jgi:two-component system LytT family response regulator
MTSAELPPALRLVVADDEPAVRDELSEILSRDRRLSVIALCGDGYAALDAIRAHRPDAVLLDVQMPGLTGVEVVAALTDAERPPTIFVTAYDAFAVRAFELNAIDFILKPFDERRVTAALDRLVKRIEVERRAGSAMPADTQTPLDRAFQSLLEPAPPRPDRFVVSHGTRLRVIPTKDIDWIEAADNYVQIHARGEASLCRATMHTVETRLDPIHFVRVHRSFIVNLARIRELQLQPSGDYDVVLTSGATVPLGRTYRERVLALLQR